MKKPKLTQAQRVMHWLSQGWGARVSSGAAVEVNARVPASLLDGHH